MLGSTISHYRILEKLGGGGMGVVYKAEDTRLKRTVALKFLPPDLTSNPEAKQRFFHEAQAASALDHPNICTVYEVNETEDGQLFIAMACYEGETLRQKIGRGRLEMEDVLDIAAQIAQGLVKAHEQGIIHRDIKPANIMITNDGVVKIVDFGLAKLSGLSRLTRTGSTLGTVAYMPPEQLQGSPVDARADIFSFGVVLYEMLAGVPPFRGEHEAALVYAILNVEPEPLQVNVPGIPSEVLHIVGRAMEKDPRDRYQTMADILIDLRRVCKETAGLTPTATRGTVRSRKKSGWLLPLGAGIVVIAAVGLWFLLSTPSPQLNPFRSTRLLTSVYNGPAPFPSFGNIEPFPSISRDGKWVTFISKDAKGDLGIYYMNIARGEPQRLTTTTPGSRAWVEISPDGAEVLFSDSPQGIPGVYTIPTSGGRSRLVVEPGGRPRWRPDGQRIGYLRAGKQGRIELYSVNADGTDNRLEFVDSLRRSGRVGFDWSPDGTSIAWIHGMGDTSEIFIHDLRSGSERQLTNFGKFVAEVSWATNNEIFFTADISGLFNIWMIPAQGGEPTQVTTGSGDQRMVRISEGARRLVYFETKCTAQLWTADGNGDNPRQVPFEVPFAENVSLSPDKRWIAYNDIGGDLHFKRWRVVVISSDGTQRYELTRGEHVGHAPVWSPDGKWLAYTSKANMREPVDSVRVRIVEPSRGESAKTIVRGAQPWWIDSSRFVAQFGGINSGVYSFPDGELLETSKDSTIEFPLPDRKHVLVHDLRRSREGWWLIQRSAHGRPAERRLVADSEIDNAEPSTSMKYLLVADKDGKTSRISLPDGRREILPSVLDRVDWMDFRFSWDDKAVAYCKKKYQTEIILVDNVIR